LLGFLGSVPPPTLNKSIRSKSAYRKKHTMSTIFTVFTDVFSI
jgi:hypothetical protein